MASDGKVVISTELDNSGIEKDAKEMNRSLKSQVMKLAHEYKKQGMSMSVAMKKAYAEIMHRIVLREGMRKIPLSYGFLKAEEYRFMESLFKGRSHFEVEIIGLDGDSTKFDAYRSKHSITIRNTYFFRRIFRN